MKNILLGFNIWAIHFSFTIPVLKVIILTMKFIILFSDSLWDLYGQL